MTLRALIVTILFAATAISFAYGAEAFVRSQIGGPPCEASNSCGWWQ